MKVVEEEQRVRVMEGEWEPRGVIREIVDTGDQEDPFYVLDLGEVVARHRAWREMMPRVEPFYAVKCNDDKLLLTTLAALGTGFDCASKAEIEAVLQLGVKPDRVIFANPAKMSSHIRHAGAVGVRTMTFDSETELMKIKHFMPDAKLVIRIRCDATDAQCPLGIKFGCDPLNEAPRLLKLAAVLQLEVHSAATGLPPVLFNMVNSQKVDTVAGASGKVVGVSFHVGSGARETGVYARAIRYARALFDMGACLGHSRMDLLDIGGGFPGNHDTSIEEVARVINSSLETIFPEREVRVIAEPGRYFAAAAYTLAAMVHSKREVTGKDGTSTHTMYFINDGVYGSFNCVLYDHQVVHPELLNCTGDKSTECSVWGPSCDGLDCVVEATVLPPLRVGDWLLFRDMGAYTLPVASPFNGFPVPRVRAVIDQNVWSELKEQLPLTESHFVVDGRVTPPQAPVSPIPSHHAVFVECALK